MRTPLLIALLAACVCGQNIALPNFSNLSSLTLNQNATTFNNALRVTSSVISQRGTAFWNNPIPVGLGFETTFTFQITSLVSSGGDGLAFVLHNDPRGVTALGNHASALGYGAFVGVPTGTAIANSLVVEFDTFLGNFNGFPDLSSNEISVHTGGAGDNSQGEDFSIGRANAPVSMKNGQVHTATIRYTPGLLVVTMNNTQVLSIPYSLDTGGQHILGTAGPVGGLNLLPGGLAYVGFSASCGGSYENHDILSWSFSAVANDPCFAGTVGSTAGGPYDILTVNNDGGSPGRRVLAATNSLLSIDLATSPVSLASANFIIVGLIGIPSLSDTFATPFGTFCFPPAPISPAPNRFVLADSFSLGLGALVPATASPWNLTLPQGLSTPLTLTLQGIVENGLGAYEITNAVVVTLF
jgi:hypothetical protein